MISLETGKPIAQSGREWGLSIDQFRWYAEEARRIYGRIVESRVPGGRFEIHHEPVGIVAAFTAWNFPAALIARKVAPALAAGCATILRPSSQTPGVAMVMVDCCRAGTLPAGAVNLVIGPTDATYAPIMAAKAGNYDVVIADTAGRLHTKSNLMEELAKVYRIVKREIPEGPAEDLIVLDAVTGQNGFLQAETFSKVMPVTGVVLTKFDNTSKGGIVLAIAEKLGMPIRYVGLGEGIDDLELFDPGTFVDTLLDSEGND